MTPLTEITFQDKTLFLKHEQLNPTGSIYDRIALKIFHRIKSQLTSTSTIVIPTSGNLGLSLARLVVGYGVKIQLVVPDKTNRGRVVLLSSMDKVDIVRSTFSAHPKASNSTQQTSLKWLQSVKGSLLVDLESFEVEVLEAVLELVEEVQVQLDGVPLRQVVLPLTEEVLVNSLIQQFKQKFPTIKVVLVEPKGSSALLEKNPFPHPQQWLVENLGAPFPLNIYNYDQAVQVEDKDSFSTAKKLVARFGIFVGPSSGSVVFAASQLSNATEAKVLVLLDDTLHHYTSTLLSEDYLLQNELLDYELQTQYLQTQVIQFRNASIEDLQLPAAHTIPCTTPIQSALQLMLELDFSQLPVTDTQRKLVGYVALGHLQHLIDTNLAKVNDSVDLCTFKFLKGTQPTVANNTHGNTPTHRYTVLTPDTPLAELAKFLLNQPVGFVTDVHRKWCLAVVTKFDLNHFLTKRNY